MIDFPNAPTPGQQFTAGNGVVYQWNGTFWTAMTGVIPAVPPHRSFRVAHSANVGIGADGTVRVPFDTVMFDDSNGAWRSGSQDFIAPEGGYWSFDIAIIATIDWLGGGGGQLELWIEQYLIGGGSYKHGTTVWIPAGGAACNLSFGQVMKMSPNDGVVVWLRNTSTTSGATIYAGNDRSNIYHYSGIRVA